MTTKTLVTADQATELVQLDATLRALAEIDTITDAKDFRDRAATLLDYAKRVGLGRVDQNRIAEAVVRGARRCGEILKDMEKNLGGPVRSHDVTTPPPTYDELGIQKMQASRWQKIALIPIDEAEVR